MTRNEKLTEALGEKWWKTNPEIVEGVGEQPRDGFLLFAKPATASVKKKGFRFTFTSVTSEGGWRNIPYVIHDTLEEGFTAVALELAETDTVYFPAVRRFGGRKLAQKMIAKVQKELQREYV